MGEEEAEWGSTFPPVLAEVSPPGRKQTVPPSAWEHLSGRSWITDLCDITLTPWLNSLIAPGVLGYLLLSPAVWSVIGRLL